MRILFVTLAVPYPPTNGQQLRNWALLRAFAQEGYKVTLVALARQEVANSPLPEELLGVCEAVEAISFNPPASRSLRDYAGRLRTLLAPRPSGVYRYQSAELTDAVRRWLGDRHFDAVLCDDSYVIGNIPRTCAAPVILNKHDLTYVIVRRYLEHVRNPLHLVYGWIEYWKLKRWEHQACRNSTLVVACSSLDREIIERACSGVEAAVVPNAIDTDAYRPQSRDDGRTLLFFGSLDFVPNQDAIRYFVSSIFPLIRGMRADVRFVIAGRNAPDDLIAYLAGVAGVELIGAVEDMRQVIAQATVCIVPLRIGSGTRLKIIEAAAMNKPIVSTRLGAEGLDFEDGSEIILADEAGAFAKAVADLLTDSRQRLSVGGAAGRRARSNYSLQALRRSIRAAFARFTPAAEKCAARVE